jgi:hypothetical protein
MAHKKYARTCSECGKGMNEGYCFDGGRAYYCSDECLHKHFTPEEWEDWCDDCEGDSYYTEWDADDEDDDEISDGEKLTRIATALRAAYGLVEEGSEAQGYIAEALAYADGDLSSFDEEDKA